MSDDWRLNRCPDNKTSLLWYTDGEIDFLREKLIEDCFAVFEDRGHTISGHTFKEIINKRFGVEEGGRK